MSETNSVERQVGRLCQEDNWNRVLDDPAPRAVRWAVRNIERRFTPDWSKWHYTEGNGAFTACGEAVVPFAVDGSPQEQEVSRVTCNRCLRKMQSANTEAMRHAAKDER